MHYSNDCTLPISLAAGRKTPAPTLGERFLEMVCPSLLRKEMGDLVLAIRTAFSSAFRSKESVEESNKSQQQAGGCCPAMTTAGRLTAPRSASGSVTLSKARGSQEEMIKQGRAWAWMPSLFFSHPHKQK